MWETRRLAAFLLILAIVVSCVHITAAAAIAANNTTAAKTTATPTITAKPTAGNVSKPVANVTGAINGTVFDAAGNLVPNADVYLHDGRGVAMGLTLTDQNGSYSYTELDPGNYSIVVQVDGYAWFKKFVVTAGGKGVSNIYIPDYVHYPLVTPWPTPVNNSTSSGSKTNISPKPTTKPAANITGNNSTGTGNATKPAVNTTAANSTTGVNGSAVNETAEASGGGSPIDGIINGIVGFFQSLFGMSG